MGDLNSDATGFGVGVGYTAHLDIDHTIFLSQLSFVQYIDLSPFRTQANIMHLHNTRPEIYKITTSKKSALCTWKFLFEYALYFCKIYKMWQMYHQSEPKQQ